MPTLPVPKFEPGRARYNSAVTDDVLNVLPAADGYKPLPGPKAFVPAFEVLTDAGDDAVLGTEDDEVLITGPGGAALTGEVNLPGTLGGIYVKTADGTQVIVVGTQTGLWRLAADSTWEEISGPSAPYSVGVDKRWSFALFGTTILAQNFSDPEQQYDIITDSAFSDNATAPRCAYIGVFGPFVIRGCLVDDETAVQWSAPEDFTSNEAGIGNSDMQPIPEGGVVTGIIAVSTGFVAMMRESIHLMSFAPDSGLVFTRTIVTNYRGCIAPYSIRALGQDDFVFYAQDGFFRGIGQTPIGAERIDPWFQETVDYSARLTMITGTDFRRKTVWFRYLDSSSTPVLLGYQWQLDQWTKSDADLADMFQAETYGVTIDQMDNFFATIDDINVPYDSSFWDGGAPDLAGMTSDGFLAFMNGEALAARIATNDITFNGMKRSFVNGGRAVTDAVNFTAQLSSANYRGAEFLAKSPVSPTTRSRFLSLRGDGQVHRVLFEIPEGEDWSTFNEFEIEAVPSGGA
jgi:hypothetical protein